MGVFTCILFLCLAVEVLGWSWLHKCVDLVNSLLNLCRGSISDVKTGFSLCKCFTLITELWFES